MSQDTEFASCLSIEGLEAYMENRLSPEDRAALERHLAECRLCCDAIEGIGRYGEFRELEGVLDSLEGRLRSVVEAFDRNR